MEIRGTSEQPNELFAQQETLPSATYGQDEPGDEEALQQYQKGLEAAVDECRDYELQLQLTVQHPWRTEPVLRDMRPEVVAKWLASSVPTSSKLRDFLPAVKREDETLREQLMRGLGRQLKRDPHADYPRGAVPA